MNMASIGTLLCIIMCVICVNEGNAGFIKLQCKDTHVGQYGQQTLLECVIHSAENVRDVKVRVVTWKRQGTKEALLVFKRGNLMPLPGYSFAEPSWNDTNMNVSLLINNTTVEHVGSYECLVMTDSGDDERQTRLEVRAKYSTPTIRAKPEKITRNTDVTLVCKAKGGYPQGQLRWFDEHNAEWTKSAEMEPKKTQSGLFDLSSKLTLLRNSVFSEYTCVVFNASGGKEEEVTFEIKDEPKFGEREAEGSDRASKIVAPLVVIGSLIIGLLLVLFYKKRKSQQDRRQSTAALMGDHQEVCTCELGVEEGGHQKMDTKCQLSLA